MSLGVSAEKVFISGWGINKPNIKPKNSCEDSLTCLVFGVLRKSKRIERLVDIFLEADDPRLKLELIGKNIDIDISSLMRRIRNSKSKTRIEIEDRFVQREEFNTIFERADLFVLSHDMTFQSISGPLFNAVESNRPILCFSYADTREMVKKNNLGECVNMENMNQPLHNICKNALSNYKPESMDYFLWGNIVARIKDNLKKDA